MQLNKVLFGFCQKILRTGSNNQRFGCKEKPRTVSPKAHLYNIFKLADVINKTEHMLRLHGLHMLCDFYFYSLQYFIPDFLSSSTVYSPLTSRKTLLSASSLSLKSFIAPSSPSSLNSLCATAMITQSAS